MSAPPAQRRGEQEAGFTLVELMVVILIIGILIAIALPTYVGARTRAQNRAAQSELRSAYVAATTFYAANETYTGFNVAAALSAEPSVNWVAGGNLTVGGDGAAPALGEITIEVATGNSLLLIDLAESGTYWCIAQVPGSPLNQKGGSTTYPDVDTTMECTQGW